ncbi:flagellin FliC [bacterium]|nr:flagellin FliC [bacterium]
MPISVNTNLSVLTAQKSLNTSTERMNTAMERLTTGYRINNSKDDAAGMAVSSKLNFKISSLKVAQNNGQMGGSLLDTQEGVLSVISSNITRIRELTEQAANGAYGSDSMRAIQLEVKARLEEVSRIALSTEFNGKYLLDGSITQNICLQVGIESNGNSIIELNSSLFESCTTTALIATGIYSGQTIDQICDTAYQDDSAARTFLSTLDSSISNITNRITQIGGIQQRILSAIDATVVMSNNMTSANSTIQDADIAVESSNYIKQQILQQISTSMLSTANQSPAIALSLLG